MRDPVLGVLDGLHLVSDEHQKRTPVATLQEILRAIGFQKISHRRSEFGLNNLMVASRRRG
jgi:hypothetical protein